MIGPQGVKRLLELLWPADQWGGYEVWAVLDGARSARVHEMVGASYRAKSPVPFGGLHPALQLAAPYLLQLQPNDLLTKRLLAEAWNGAWGLFLRSDARLLPLRRHLASLLRVTDEQHRRLVFRYYDPRVLRIFLPSCTEAELAAIFGPIFQFVMEGEHPDTLVSFRHDAKQLQSETYSLLEGMAYNR